MGIAALFLCSVAFLIIVPTDLTSSCGYFHINNFDSSHIFSIVLQIYKTYILMGIFSLILLQSFKVFFPFLFYVSCSIQLKKLGKFLVTFSMNSMDLNVHDIGNCLALNEIFIIATNVFPCCFIAQ